MDNGKKEFPESAQEQDAIFARHYYTSLVNNRGGLVKKYKRVLNKRFRARNKKYLHSLDTTWHMMWDYEDIDEDDTWQSYFDEYDLNDVWDIWDVDRHFDGMDEWRDLNDED